MRPPHIHSYFLSLRFDQFRNLGPVFLEASLAAHNAHTSLSLPCCALSMPCCGLRVISVACALCCDGRDHRCLLHNSSPPPLIGWRSSEERPARRAPVKRLACWFRSTAARFRSETDSQMHGSGGMLLDLLHRTEPLGNPNMLTLSLCASDLRVSQISGHCCQSLV